MTLNRRNVEKMIDALNAMHCATDPTCKDELLLIELRRNSFQILLALDDIGELKADDLRAIDPMFVSK